MTGTRTSDSKVASPTSRSRGSLNGQWVIFVKKWNKPVNPKMITENNIAILVTKTTLIKQYKITRLKHVKMNIFKQYMLTMFIANPGFVTKQKFFRS